MNFCQCREPVLTRAVDDVDRCGRCGEAIARQAVARPTEQDGYRGIATSPYTQGPKPGGGDPG